MASSTRLGQIRVQSGVTDEFQLAAALAEDERCGHRLGVTRVRLGFLDEPDLVRALEELLVERGVLDFDEVAERVARIQARDAAGATKD